MLISFPHLVLRSLPSFSLLFLLSPLQSSLLTLHSFTFPHGILLIVQLPSTTPICSSDLDFVCYDRPVLSLIPANIALLRPCDSSPSCPECRTKGFQPGGPCAYIHRYLRRSASRSFPLTTLHSPRLAPSHALRCDLGFTFLTT